MGLLAWEGGKGMAWEDLKAGLEEMESDTTAEEVNRMCIPDWIGMTSKHVRKKCIDLAFWFWW